MKKIGIITIVGNNNYGNRLQHYAITKVFKKLGYDCEALILNQRKGSIKYIPRALRMIVSQIKEVTTDKKSLNGRRLARFLEFNSDNNIIIKNKPFWSKNIKKKFSYFSIGSDQIWNPNFDYGYSTEFAEFAASKQRIAFSPSFGVDYIPDSKMENYIRGLNGFNIISVREENGAELVRKLTGKTSTVLIDPTLMLSKDEWEVIVSQSKEIDASKPYILEYFLGKKSIDTERQIEELSKNSNLERYELLNEANPDLYCTGPAEFLYLIKNADLIVTDSFHATVFSIIFNKKFIAFERQNEKGMSSRINTLLRKLEVTNEEFNGKLIKPNIEFYNEKLQYEKKKVYDFLKKSMGLKSEDRKN